MTSLLPRIHAKQAARKAEMLAEISIYVEAQDDRLIDFFVDGGHSLALFNSKDQFLSEWRLGNQAIRDFCLLPHPSGLIFVPITYKQEVVTLAVRMPEPPTTDPIELRLNELYDERTARITKFIPALRKIIQQALDEATVDTTSLLSTEQLKTALGEQYDLITAELVSEIDERLVFTAEGIKIVFDD